MTEIDPTSTLGALVTQRPGRIALFERLRLDYCCGGGQTLAEASTRRGLDVHTVCAVLEALDDAPVDRAEFDDFDWRRASLDELCTYIVDRHAGLRKELPRIDELLSTVVRVHGAGHPELHDLQRAFLAIREELEPHLELEERTLFPACRALEADGASIDEALLTAHERDHEHVGDGLAALRELTSDYDSSHALCGTHRALLGALRSLELDLHEHIHEENNVLFCRVRELNGALPCATEGRLALTNREDARRRPGDARAEALPRCCQTWIIENARRRRRPHRPPAAAGRSPSDPAGAQRQRRTGAIAE